MTISSSPMPASLAGRRLSRGTQHTVPRTVFLAAITRKRRSNSSGCRERGPCRCQKMIKTSSSVCIRWKRPKQSRSPPRPGLRPPRQPLRRAKQRPPPPAMLVPGRRWAREERASSSASSSVCPSPSPDAPPQAPTRRCSGSRRSKTSYVSGPSPREWRRATAEYRSILRARGGGGRVAAVRWSV